jgi:hypothetical protein
MDSNMHAYTILVTSGVGHDFCDTDEYHLTIGNDRMDFYTA